MLKQIQSAFSYNLQCLPGKRVDQKIVIIESDDWGSVRMSSKKAYDSLLRKGVPVNKSFYNKYDSLASADDLECLFEVLAKHKGKNGKSPVITANTIVANPDFEKIRKDDFEKYHFEPFTDTLKKYSASHHNSYNLWREGINNEFFIPQFHGREHLNCKRWMASLKAGDKAAHAAFDENVFGYPIEGKSAFFTNYMAAFDIDSPEEKAEQMKIVEEGLEMFENLIGYKAESFIAPNYIWHDAIEEILSENGVKQLQSGLYQFRPDAEKKKYNKVIHYIGQRNKFGLEYSVRNCFFEPSFSDTGYWMDNCLERIAVAFRWKKPAIICSHRINYIGSIEKSNRDKSLKQLDMLLKTIINKWPDVVFMSSNQLNNYLNGES